jgi:DNA replication and repair protein RecF
MKITHFEICHFRNLQQVILDPGQKINIFYGQNGSGKTSLLEAIHYLGLGRSFRTRYLNRIIRHEAHGFSLFCQLYRQQVGILPVGIERTPDAFTIKLGGKAVHSLVELAELIPLQLINADSHLLLSSGPLVRRQFLDWGVFHVEPQFFHYWQRAHRIIKQRNANLKVARCYREIQSWDDELQSCSNWLDVQRKLYVSEFKPVFIEIFNKILPACGCMLQYYSGWNKQLPLGEILRSSFEKDKRLGYTQFGPHRADFSLKINAVPASDLMSQGEQKLAAYTLRLAQGKLLQQKGNRQCIFLIDDLPSELDKDKRKLVSEVLASLDSQIFVTGIERESLSDLQQSPETQMFHVEQGLLSRLS